MPMFAVAYTYEDAQTDAREANKPAHREWLAAQVAEGTIHTVGPFVDGSGALLIVEDDDEAGAAALVGKDPHCVQGFVSSVTIRQWKPVFGALS